MMEMEVSTGDCFLVCAIVFYTILSLSLMEGTDFELIDLNSLLLKSALLWASCFFSGLFCCPNACSGSSQGLYFSKGN